MTKHKFLKDATALALSRVDKQSASQLAATVAGAVARRGRHPGLRMVADLVAQGLSAPTQQPDQTAPQRPTAPGQQPNPNATATEGWQQALQRLHAARSQGSGPAGASTAHASTASAKAPSGEGRTVSRGILSGGYDAANIGAFAFSLYNGTQLQVNQLRALSNVGGQFWLADLPAGIWHRLKDRGERRLPVWIRVHGSDLDVQVGGGPNGAPVLQATDMLPRSTLG